MNLIDAVVLKVLSKPIYVDDYKDKGITWWYVDVESIDMGGVPQEETLTFKTEEEALKVVEGYEFMH